MTRVLIVGVSTRAFAESAARAGYEVVAIDGFGDLDLGACAAEVHIVRAKTSRRFSARGAAAAAREIRCDAVVYESSFENHPAAVRALAATRPLWGNSPAVLAHARNPRRLTRALRDAGLAAPEVRFTRPPNGARATWMLKRVRSGGGEGVAVWRRGAALERGSYLQRRLAGVAGSIVFAADGHGGAVPLGVSRILAGDARFGADGFRYCGNILAPAGDLQFPDDDRLLGRATRVAQAVTRAFGLVGVNGVDFVARRGVPYAIEVNPRYTAAMELVERAYGLSVFRIHAQACHGELPAFDLAAARQQARQAVGKAILYARRPITLGDSRAWLADRDVRDISPPGTRFAPRDPICTIIAGGGDGQTCLEALRQRAVALYDTLERREARIA